MNLEITRQACCAQDDQLGPLTLNLQSSDLSTIQDLAKAIGESGFLQFSGTHNLIVVCSGGVELLSIPSLGNESRSVEYAVNKFDLAANHIKSCLVECKWPSNL